MPNEKRSFEQPKLDAGPYLAKIVSHLDPKYMGNLEVELLRDVGNLPGRTGNTLTVKYLSPFYGSTNIQYNGMGEDFQSTQKSYGFWMIPPDPGTIVLVIFVEGDPRLGFWIGCVQDEYMNFMIPGLAATEMNSGEPGTKKTVAEYNKMAYDLATPDTTQVKKPVHDHFDKVLTEQGLAKDEFRGTTSSSARREVPSSVFGISTPGPVDRTAGAPKGPIGKFESKIDGAFVGRMGGTTFVMDDGDDKFLRKTKPFEGPPEYANAEAGETAGPDPEIPANELVRIRTRTGHQILLHNSEDLIYIGNARGTAWIELTSMGKIDIYAKDSVSIHTENDFNFHAKRDINFWAENDINFTADKNYKLQVGEDSDVFIKKNSKIRIDENQDLQIGKNYKILTEGGDLDINITGHIWETSSGSNETKAGGNIVETAPQIHMNGPAASEAAKAEKAKEGKYPARDPLTEPWMGHENFSPAPGAEATNSKPSPPGGEPPKLPDTFKKGG